MPNLPRWDGSQTRFYEVWYFIFSDPNSGDGYWIRYTLLNPPDKHPDAGATLWFGYTCKANPDLNLAISRTFPGSELRIHHDSLDLTIDCATLKEGALCGAFDAHGHRVEWDLKYDPNLDPHYFIGPTLRRLTETRSSVTIPNPRIFLSGRISVDGAERSIEQAPGHQAHHWGTDRASRWLWGHCSAFDQGQEAVVEMLSAGLPGGLSLTFVNLHSPRLEIKASGATDIPFNSARAGLGFWSFEAYTGNHKLLVDVHVDPRHVLKFIYTSPNYVTSECWNTQVGDCLVRVYERSSRLGGFSLREVLKARGSAAAEIHDVNADNIPYPAWWGTD